MKFSNFKGKIILLFLWIVGIGFITGFGSLLRILFYFFDGFELNINKHIIAYSYFGILFGVFILYGSSFKFSKVDKLINSDYQLILKNKFVFFTSVIICFASILWHLHIYLEQKRSHIQLSKMESKILTKNICNWHLLQVLDENITGHLIQGEEQEIYNPNSKKLCKNIKDGKLSFMFIDYEYIGEDPIIEYEETTILKNSVLHIKVQEIGKSR